MLSDLIICTYFVCFRKPWGLSYLQYIGNQHVYIVWCRFNLERDIWWVSIVCLFVCLFGCYICSVYSFAWAHLSNHLLQLQVFSVFYRRQRCDLSSCPYSIRYNPAIVCFSSRSPFFYFPLSSTISDGVYSNLVLSSFSLNQGVSYRRYNFSSVPVRVLDIHLSFLYHSCSVILWLLFSCSLLILFDCSGGISGGPSRSGRKFVLTGNEYTWYGPSVTIGLDFSVLPIPTCMFALLSFPLLLCLCRLCRHALSCSFVLIRARCKHWLWDLDTF